MVIKCAIIYPLPIVTADPVAVGSFVWRNMVERNIEGVRFGNLVAIRIVGHKKLGGNIWECRCDCNNICNVDAANLRSGHTKSCGCLKNAKRNTRFRDLIGLKFNMLTVLGMVGKNKSGSVEWLCVCECGASVIVTTTSLTLGRKKSCGCSTIKMRSDAISDDLSGKTIGRLTVIAPHSRSGYYECLCSCGKTVYVSGGNLRRCERGEYKVVSCGCYNKERLTKHGLRFTREYLLAKSKRRRDKEILLDAEWTTQMEIEVRRFFSDCVVCHSTKSLSVDHVLPLDKGFGLSPSNAVLLCKSCNSTKRDKMPEDLPEPMRSLILDSAKKFAEYWEWLQTPVEETC